MERFLSFRVGPFSVVREAASDHSSVRKHERNVIKEPLSSHSDVVKDDSLPERQGSVRLSPASRHCEMSTHHNENSKADVALAHNFKTRNDRRGDVSVLSRAFSPSLVVSELKEDSKGR